MAKEIFLNDTSIRVYSYNEDKENGRYRITIDFEVTSEDYHDITTLLYLGTFDIKIPERDLTFKGSIQQYSTSITNLYEKGQIGRFHLTLLEVN